MEVARAGQRATPPVPVPGPLRPLLRFTRLQDAALAIVRRVLDEDDGFRDRVLGSLEETGGRALLDEASLLFLDRPQGWSASLAERAAAEQEEAATAAAARAEAAATRRVAVVQAALDRAEEALRAARREAEALRAEVGEERRARVVATSDLGRLRKRVGELEALPREAAVPEPAGEEELSALRAAVAAAEARAASAEAAAEELRRAAGAGTPEVSGAGTLGRGTPAAPEVDQVVAAAVSAAVDAVGALADALGRAATALARGQAGRDVPPPPSPLAARDDAGGRPDAGGAGPPRPRRRPAPLPPAVFDDAAAAAEHLLRLPGVLVLVDGYNVTISARGDLPLPAQRRWLLDAAAGAAARTGAEFEVVFDGAEAARPAGGGRPLGVQVRFTAPGEEADDVVLDLACLVPADRPVVVVSDDRRVRDGARRLGANVLGVGQLVEVLRR